MEKYRKGTLEDAQDIVDFADYVFSQSSEPHDFARLVPKLYDEGRKTQQYHYLVEEEGKIRAMLCVLPVRFTVAGVELKAGCVGTVAVHPRARGKGYMQKLMAYALEDMKTGGYDYSVLGGQRQRYEYFGYEPAGIKLDFTLTADNVRHKYRHLDATGISFEELSGPSLLLDESFALYQKGVISGARNKESFADILRTWNAVPYAILQNGKFVGYLSVSRGGGMVFEIELTDEALLPLVCKSLMEFKKPNELRFSLPAFDRDKIALLGGVCDMYGMGFNLSYNIVNYASVIEAFMKCKALGTKLPEGAFTLRIEDRETVEMVVHNGQITVNRHEPDDPRIKPDAVLTARDATALLFSPLSGYMKSKTGYWDNPEYELPAWFPLPLYSPLQDGC